jgi:hypothetical protein
MLVGLPAVFFSGTRESRAAKNGALNSDPLCTPKKWRRFLPAGREWEFSARSSLFHPVNSAQKHQLRIRANARHRCEIRV